MANESAVAAPWTVLAACPACRGALVDDEALRCAACRRVFPIIDGVPRFVPDEAYAASFGLQWERHRSTQLDSVSGRPRSRDDFFAKTGLTPAELDGALVLDVGVGSGRYSEIAADHGARVVGIDLSRAAGVAARNLAGRARIAQADLFAPPFRDGTFDVVFAIGVLHHTPDTRSATASIARLVKPGGILAIWVYAHTFAGHFSNLYRRVTTRLGPETLYRLSAAGSALYQLHGVPVVGRLLRTAVPISTEPNREWRILDTFDWYAPTYQWHHTPDEVAGWFDALGFEDVRRLPPPVAVRGRKPA